MAAAAVAEHQLSDVGLRRAVDDRLAGGEDRVLLLEAPEDVDGDVRLGIQRIDHEAVGRMDDLLVAQVEHDEVALDLRAAADLLDGALAVLVVERDALGDVGGLQDLLDGHPRAVVDQLHHQLVVRDPELAEAPEAGAGVHQERHEDPAARIEDLGLGEARRVSLVDRGHHRFGDRREALGAAVVVVDDARGALRAGHDDVVRGGVLDADRLGRVMVEREPDAGHVGQVRGDVARAHLDLAVLHVLGVDEEDVVEQTELLQERGADEAVEVGAGDQAVANGRSGVCVHSTNIGSPHQVLRAASSGLLTSCRICEAMCLRCG